MTYRRATIVLALIVGLLLGLRYTGPTRSDLAARHDSLTTQAYRLGYVQGQLDAQRGVMDGEIRSLEFRSHLTNTRDQLWKSDKR